MLQELLPLPAENTGGYQPDLTSMEKTGERSATFGLQESLPECHVSKRKSPQFQVCRRSITNAEAEMKKTFLKNILWIIVRLHTVKTNCQQVPSWSGFISRTGDAPQKLTTIDYFPVIPHPITEYATVQETLKYAEEATKEVNQKYVITTYDLGVCMKAFPIIWNEPRKYKNHIIMIGTFHILCTYMKMIGNKIQGTGLSDILLESELMSCGSLVGVLKGKSYARALNCHKVMLESLERLLFEKFLALQGDQGFSESLSQQSKIHLEEFVMDISKENELNLLSEEEFTTKIDHYCNFRKAVKQGNYGKTSQLWLTYMDHVWLMLGLIHSVKTNNFVEYTPSLYLMPDLFFSFGGYNYAHYLTFFAVLLANIECSHPGATEMLEQGAFSVARSFIPGNRSVADKTIEETFMKHAKLRGGGGTGAGLSGTLKNQEAYQRWTRTMSERTKYYQATLSLADMTTEICDGLSQKDLKKAEIILQRVKSKSSKQ